VQIRITQEALLNISMLKRGTQANRHGKASAETACLQVCHLFLLFNWCNSNQQLIYYLLL
jgi:hypothetical protein